MPTAPKPATDHTHAHQARVAASLPPEDGRDWEEARAGFLGTLEDAVIPGRAEAPAWTMAPFRFVAGEAPPEVNPSLWRQAQLNGLHGLFEVVPGIYQVRGFDLSNITFVEGKDGVVVIDPLISAETAAAALGLYRRHRGERPVAALLYTHCHVDHYGGALGVVTRDQVAAGLPVLAPEHFLKYAVGETVLAGNAMNRRATYMYGALLPRGPRGHVDAGLGKTVSTGSVGLLPPTDHVTRTGEERVLDGVRFRFQLTPETEAPAEMNLFLPDHRALCMAENTTAHLHNLYTPRGALVRDAKAWSGYIQEAITLFGGETDVLFACHHWPRLGRERALAYLAKQRDLYKYIHDQTLRLANHGLTPREIAEELCLPPELTSEWHTRDYYGTLNHNAKAVYQRYLGWFDGNPAHLHPLPPADSAARYVAAMGGPDAVLAQGRAAFAEGAYRWGAELVNHLVFAHPELTEARELQADLLEQLGYQAESGPWRAFYLTGAQELRAPRAPAAQPRQAGAGTLRGLPVDDLLDAMAVRLNGPKASGVRLAIDLELTDEGRTVRLDLENGALRHGPPPPDAEPAAARLTLTRLTLAEMMGGLLPPPQALAEGRLAIGGDASCLARLFALLDRFEFWFNIIEP